MSNPRISTPNWKPSFHGFPTTPGTYSAVVDIKGVEQDETGIFRLPYIFDPSGNGPVTVIVGKPL